MPSVLLIEKNHSSTASLVELLVREGLDIRVVSDGADALEALGERAPGLVLLNAAVSRGLELLARVRAVSESVAVVVFGLDDDLDVATAFRLGADDCLRRPASVPELVQRVHAILRRVRAQAGPTVLESGPLRIDAARRLAFVGSEPLHLPPKTFDVLYALMAASGRFVPERDLLRTIAHTSAELKTRRVGYHITELRRQLRPFAMDVCIRTVRAHGYEWTLPVERIDARAGLLANSLQKASGILA